MQNTTISNIHVNYKCKPELYCSVPRNLFTVFFSTSKPWSNNNSYSLENFAELLKKFQLALHCHYNTGGHFLYQPDELKLVCQTHSPHLYDILPSSITQVNGCPTQKNHIELKQQREVVLLHTLAYFRYSINFINLRVQHEPV